MGLWHCFGGLCWRRRLGGLPILDAALGFMLPSLFLALLLSILSRAQVPVIGVAAVTTVVVTLLGSGSMGILAGMLAGAVTGLMRRGVDAQ